MLHLGILPVLIHFLLIESSSDLLRSALISFAPRDNPIYRVKPSTQILKYDADVFQLLNSHYQDFTLACLVAIQKQDDLEDSQEPELETTERTTTASKFTKRLWLNDRPSLRIICKQ